MGSLYRFQVAILGLISSHLAGLACQGRTMQCTHPIHKQRPLIGNCD